MCLLRCTLLSSLLLLLVCSIHETEQNSYCQQIITEKHLAELEELVSALPRLCQWMGGSFGNRQAQISPYLVLKTSKSAYFQLHQQSSGTQELSIRGHEGELSICGHSGRGGEVTRCRAPHKGGCGKVLLEKWKKRSGNWQEWDQEGGMSGAEWARGRWGSSGGKGRGVFRAAAQGLSRGIRLHS